MRRYWYEGNSECFIYLLHLMERLRIYRNLLKEQGDDESEDEDDEQDPLRNAKNFFRSFKHQAKELWEEIVAPYSKQAQDMSDFIAGNDEEEGEDEVPHHVFDQEEVKEEEDADKALVDYYVNRSRETNGSDDGSHYEDEDEGAEDDDRYEQEQESSESEDDWVKGIRNKSRKNSVTPAKKRAANGSEGKKKRIKRSNDEDDSDSDDSNFGAPNKRENGSHKKTSPSAQRAILEDSD